MVGTKLSSSLLPYVDPDPEGEGKIVAVNDDVDFTHHRFALHVVVSRVTIILTRVITILARVTTILTRVTIFIGMDLPGEGSVAEGRGLRRGHWTVPPPEGVEPRHERRVVLEAGIMNGLFSAR